MSFSGNCRGPYVFDPRVTHAFAPNVRAAARTCKSPPAFDAVELGAAGDVRFDSSVGQLVQDDDVVARVEEPFREPRADEAGASGDEHAHAPNRSRLLTASEATLPQAPDRRLGLSFFRRLKMAQVTSKNRATSNEEARRDVVKRIESEGVEFVLLWFTDIE